MTRLFFVILFFRAHALSSLVWFEKSFRFQHVGVLMMNATSKDGLNTICFLRIDKLYTSQQFLFLQLKFLAPPITRLYDPNVCSHRCHVVTNQVSNRVTHRYNIFCQHVQSGLVIRRTRMNYLPSTKLQNALKPILIDDEFSPTNSNTNTGPLDIIGAPTFRPQSVIILSKRSSTLLYAVIESTPEQLQLQNINEKRKSLLNLVENSIFTLSDKISKKREYR